MDEFKTGTGASKEALSFGSGVIKALNKRIYSDAECAQAKEVTALARQAQDDTVATRKPKEAHALQQVRAIMSAYKSFVLALPNEDNSVKQYKGRFIKNLADIKEAMGTVTLLVEMGVLTQKSVATISATATA